MQLLIQLLLLLQLGNNVRASALPVVHAGKRDAARANASKAVARAAANASAPAPAPLPLANAGERPKQPGVVTVDLEDDNMESSSSWRKWRSHKTRAGRLTQEDNMAVAPFVDSIFDSVFDASDVGSRALDEHPHGDDDEYHSKNVWNVIKGVRRHKSKHAARKHRKPLGVAEFFESAVFYEWCIFAIALSVFFPLFYYLQDWPSTRKFHVAALFIWIALGALYNMAVWIRLGRSAGVMWFTGYLLEFIFSIENVFVFHIVVKAFRVPQRLTQKAIFVVICCQIVFEMIFFMGLATRVRSMEVLPYLLGVWLLYVGYHAAKDDGHEDFNIKDSAIFRLSRWILGPRLMLTYDEGGSVFLFKERRLCVSLLFPLICCLLAVDFLLEVDVTLTKIEELPNEYIAFTSSAAAAFTVPELFFVARDLFQRYTLLKYGVSFVLVFFGFQMLMHSFFELPDLVGCAIIIVVMIICMMASSAVPNHKEDLDASPCIDDIKALRFDSKTPTSWSKEPMPEPECKESLTA